MLYGPEGPVERRVFEEPRLGEKHQFRFIVSPEDAGELDMTIYVQRLMKRVGKDLGRELEWGAVNHYDTAHPHAHVVVRGVDRDGCEVRFDRAYISGGIRWRAQEIATQELGPRRESEVRRTYEKEITQNRLTSLDRELERLSEGGCLELRTPKQRTRIDLCTLHARLDHLESMRMVERLDSNRWLFSDGWQERLKSLGKRNDIIKQMHDVVRGDTSRYCIVGEGKPVPVGLHGVQPDTVARVAGKGLSDEMKGAFYAVLETPEGHAYHVPIDNKTADAVRVGELVSFGSCPEPAVRPMDRHIAEAARSAGGVCIVDADGEERFRGSMVRRLRELERAGLVSAHGPDRWSVPGDLVERLERREREEPQRERVWVQKLAPSLELLPNHRGPVWLDKLQENTLARWGFGADVRCAIERRREVLRGFGTALDDPQRDVKLKELERRTVGEGMAARTRQQFLAKTPDGFRGHVNAGPDGAPYVVVTDGSRFVLLPASREVRALDGRTVGVSRDPQGRLRVGLPDMGKER
ncbi:MAG: DUF3363 domain-containing protein [Polyangiaceae bacterium]